MSKGATVSLKVMINKEKTKVLFAEANSDFAIVLLSFLPLPLGKIAKLLKDHYGDDDKARSVGSLSNLYRSVANLDDTHFLSKASKQMLLNPRSSFEDICPNLKLDISDTQPIEVFACSRHCAKNFWMYYVVGSCDNCRGPLHNNKINFVDANSSSMRFIITTASFVICDGLRLVPYATGFLHTLKSFSIEDTNGAELRNVTFGFKEIIGLLKCCLLSETPLTDLILNKTQNPSPPAKKLRPEIPLPRTEEKEDGKSRNIILKIMVQKSTNKLLFAQADDDFVELLFSFLTIPLAGVESLLHSNTCLKSVDNLYTSIADAVDEKDFTTPVLKKRLMNPKLPHGYTSVKQFLPLSEETAPTLYTYERRLYYNKPHDYATLVPFFKLPNNYVAEPSTYMVTDDLMVTPFEMTTGLSILDRLSVPPSDVDELEMNIGLEEALRILKASLTSTSALSSALSDHIFKKQPKFEHGA